MMFACAKTDDFQTSEIETSNSENSFPSSTVRTSLFSSSSGECIYGGVKIESGIDENMNGVLDDDEVDNTAYVCNGIPGTTGDNGSMPNYPYEGAPITFKIYDSSTNMIIDAISLDDIPSWHVQGFNTIRNLYSCSSEFPILDNGECILDCIGDPNLDGLNNILDIILISDLIIECDYPFLCFENQTDCMDLNQDNIIDVLDILSLINVIQLF